MLPGGRRFSFAPDPSRLALVPVRATRPDEWPTLRAIEELAGERFRDVGLEDVADHDPPPADTLGTYALAGRSWVAVDGVDEPFGYVLVDVVDGNAHVEQLSVRPDHQGQGAGRALLERVRTWALENGRPGITLTTFTHVPWNRPLFEHLGFRVLGRDETGPELGAVRRAEAVRGLQPTMRVCMRLDLEA